MKRVDHLMRQLDIIPIEKLTVPITVIGCGAIGSFVVLALAKMGFEDIQVYDFDKVSVENMNCQWFQFSDIGNAKTESLSKIVSNFSKTNIIAKNEKFEASDDQLRTIGRIVITAVDSMAVRKMIWEACKDNPKVYWYIDPRMAAEYALSFVIDPNDTKDIESYEKTLYTDEKAVEDRCTAKATMYTAMMIAGYVAKHVKDIVTKQPYARITHWNIATNVLQNWGKT